MLSSRSSTSRPADVDGRDDRDLYEPASADARFQNRDGWAKRDAPFSDSNESFQTEPKPVIHPGNFGTDGEGQLADREGARPLGSQGYDDRLTRGLATGGAEAGRPILTGAFGVAVT
jgi:hypothetical protein